MFFRSMLGLLIAACGSFSALGCDRTAEPSPGRPARPAPQVAAPAAAAPAQASATTPVKRPAEPVRVARHPGGPRVVAIGDLHGDLEAARAALRLAGATDGSDKWAGGKLVVVQTGDQLDRGDGERAIVDLFERLATEARAAGGDVVALNGNHETMNVQGDFRYVTPGGFRDFSSASPASPHADRVPPEQRERARAFLPGGAYALKLAARDTIAIVGDSLFAHAGVLPSHVEYGVDRINQEVRTWMEGKTPRIPAIIARDDAPVWTRVYGGEGFGGNPCEELGRVLSSLNARRLVVGHTVQRRGITSDCDGKLFRIDVGMARYYGSGPIQVLEIEGSNVRPLSGSRESLLSRAPEKAPTPKAVAPKPAAPKAGAPSP